jgi:SulP family sulfate permease
MATLAAVLFVVAYNMGEWHEIPDILRLGLADKSVGMITFVLTVVADLTVAVEVGMALAALLYIGEANILPHIGDSLRRAEEIERGRVA